MTPARTAWMLAPDKADPPVARVTVPEIVPVVMTVNVTPLLAFPPTVTTTWPVVAPAGTGVTIVVSLQLVGDAATPWKVTVLDPCDPRKFVPLIVTASPTTPV